MLLYNDIRHSNAATPQQPQKLTSEQIGDMLRRPHLHRHLIHEKLVLDLRV